MRTQGSCVVRHLLIAVVMMGADPFHLQAGRQAPAGVRTIVSPALRLSEPAVFSVAEGESLKVAAQGQAGFSFDIFVYDTATHDLVGRSDDDSTAPFFQWTAAAAGTYSIVLRNVSSVDGVGIVTVVPRGSKGAADTREGGLAVVEVAYATDREPTGPQAENKSILTYGGEPAKNDEMHYGFAKVSIPRAHKMGELEGRSILRFEFSVDKEKHIVLREVSESSETEFKDTISKELKSAQSQEALVYVHGFNTTFEDGLRRAAQIKYDLGFGGVAVLYSWPSHGAMNPIAYNRDGRNAELSTPHFRAFLSELAAAENVKTIHVIAHSMGNRVVMHALADGSVGTKIHLRHIALLAPDVDAAVFRRLALSMRSTADQITLYASSRDGALIASELFAGYTRAGQGRPNLIVMPGVMETVDASSVDTSLFGLYHSYFADNGTILSDLYRFFQDDAAGKRFGLREEDGATGKFWTLAARAR